MATDNLFGQMEENIRECGLMESKMDKEFTFLQVDNKKRENGNKVIE